MYYYRKLLSVHQWLNYVGYDIECKELRQAVCFAVKPRRILFFPSKHGTLKWTGMMYSWWQTNEISHTVDI